MTYFQHETAFDDTTMIKVEEGVLQAVTEKVHEMNTDTPGKIQQNCNVRVGNEYKVCPETIEAFKSGGLAILENLLTEKEMLDLEILYDKHMAGMYDTYIQYGSIQFLSVQTIT